MVAVSLVIGFCCINDVNAITCDYEAAITLNDLDVMFPEAKEELDLFRAQGTNRNSLTLESFTIKNIYISTIDSIEYNLIVYDNGYIGLSYATNSRSMKFFTFSLWGPNGEEHNLIASVYYYTDSQGKQIMTSIGAGGSTVHIYSYGVETGGASAYARANAYYVPPIGPSGLDYMGMEIIVYQNDSGVLAQQNNVYNTPFY